MSPVGPFANLLSVIFLLSGFLPLASLSVATRLLLNRAAAIALSVAAFGQAMAQHDWPFYVVGLMVLASQAVALPWAMRRMVRSTGGLRPQQGVVPVSLAMLIGLLPVALAVIGLCPSANSSALLNLGTFGNKMLVVAFAMLLLGIWQVIVAGQILELILGFMTLQNGLVLALISLPGLKLIAVIATAGLLGLGLALTVITSGKYEMTGSAPTDGASL